MKTRVILYTSFALGLFSIATSVVAGKINLSGTNCKRLSGYYEIPLYVSGAIYNTSRDQTLYVTCHVPKTDFGRFVYDGRGWIFQPGAIESGWVRVRDSSSTENVSCNIYAMSFLDSGAFQFRSNGYQYTSGTNYYEIQQLNFSSLYPYDNERAHYYISCRIPSSDVNYSAVIGYQVIQ